MRKLMILVASASLLAAYSMPRHVVYQRGKTFSMSELRVQVGDTVMFDNNDDVTHHAFSTSEGNEFNVEVMKPGAVESVVFERPGLVEVRCAFHPEMKMKVTVE